MPGWRTRYEDERLTEEDRDKLPERINELRSGKFGSWLSEAGNGFRIMLETATQPRAAWRAETGCRREQY